MATFKMASKCLVCDKRCDGHYFCSDNCREIYETATKARKTAQALADRARSEIKSKDNSLEFLNGFAKKMGL
jgi:predicted nucleic acid-binding Zn ribbon protein